MTNIIDFKHRAEMKEKERWLIEAFAQNGIPLAREGAARYVHYLNEMYALSSLVSNLGNKKSTDFKEFYSAIDAMRNKASKDPALAHTTILRELTLEFIDELSPVVDNFKRYEETGEDKFLDAVREFFESVVNQAN